MIPYLGLDNMFAEIILEMLFGLGMTLIMIGLLGILITGIASYMEPPDGWDSLKDDEDGND